jgi:ABC-type iron transport system FetAB permease component
MQKKQRVPVKIWLLLVWFVAMAISLAIKAVVDPDVFVRTMAIFALLVAGFVAGFVFALLKGRRKLDEQGSRGEPVPDVGA